MMINFNPFSRQGRLKPVFGWWGLDPEGPTLVNTVSGQKLRYVGPTQTDDTTPGGPWHRFDYEDEEVRYPILVRVQTEEFTRELRREPQLVTGPILRVDHNLSAALWRKENNSDSKTPPYGLWRRVDDCITDALPCWKELPIDAAEPKSVIVRGGWLNAKWENGIYRNFWVLDEKRPDLFNRELFSADRPFVMPLEEGPPSPWAFHWYPPHDEWSSRNIADYNAGKAEARFGPSGSYKEKVRTPHNRPINDQDFYMRSDDGKRVLFFVGAKIQRGSQHAGPECFNFQYTDDDIQAFFDGRNLNLEYPADWCFDLFDGYGLRHAESTDRELFYTVNGRNCIPSHAVWRRVIWSIFDSWFYFEGRQKPPETVTDSLAIYSTWDIQIGPNYLGGMWFAGGLYVAHLDENER